jgi:predicted Zn-dependent protease
MERVNTERLLQIALDHSQAEQTEARIITSRWALTRFANSAIHQNMASDLTSVHVRAVFGKKVASGSGTRLDEAGVSELVDDVVRMARVQDPNPDFVSLPAPMDARSSEGSFDAATAECSPEQRAEMVKAVIAESDRVGGTAAGSLLTRGYEHAVANSLGVRSCYRGTAADLVAVVTGPDGGFGYAAAQSGSVGGIDAASLGEEAADRASDSRNPADLEPGEYECILMPYAVDSLVSYLVWMGFNALAFQEGRSFLVGKLGEKIVSDSISLWDDGLDPNTLVSPYDGEGVPRQRVNLVEQGVAKELLYTSYSAHKESRKSTGHAIVGESESSGSRMNLVMGPGDATVDEMISSTKRGVLVTRFHYTNVAHLMSTSITGMTRDGTFLIENGRISCPVKNLRFTQSVTKALLDTRMIGRERRLVGGSYVPAIKIGKFRFTSGTEF